MTAGQWDEELLASTKESALLRAQLSPEEQAIVGRRVEGLNLSYLYLSSDEAHLQWAKAWVQEAKNFIADRADQDKITHAADVVPVETMTAREVLEAIGYDDPNVDPESYVSATSGGLGGSYPQEPVESVDNRYILLILKTNEAADMASVLIDSGGSAEYDMAERIHRLIARAEGA